MDPQQAKLINLGLLWNKFDRLADIAVMEKNHALAKIYNSRTSKIFQEYFVLFMELNQWKLELKFIEDKADRGMDPEEIEKMIQSHTFQEWCLQKAMDTI